MEDKPEGPVEPARAENGGQAPPPAQAGAGSSPREQATPGARERGVNYEDLQALLERYRTIEARNRDLKKQFESLPAEAHLERLQRKLGRVRDWIDDREKKEPPAPAAGPADESGDGTAAPASDEAAEWAPAGRDEEAADDAAQGGSRRLPAASWAIIAVVGISAVLAAFSLFSGPSGPGAGRSGAAQDPAAAPTLALAKQKSPEVRQTSAEHQVGLVHYKDRWLSVDWTEGHVYELDPASGLKQPRNFPNSFTTGLSAGDGALWSTDAFNRRCYRHHPETFAIQASFAAPGPAPSAVHWDGSSLWLADKETRRAYKYINMKSGAITLLQYRLLEKEPVGLWLAGSRLWALDRAEKTVRRYRIEGDSKLVPDDEVALSAWLPDKTRPVAMALSGEELWIMTESPAQLHRYAVPRLPWAESAAGN